MHEISQNHLQMFQNDILSKKISVEKNRKKKESKLVVSLHENNLGMSHLSYPSPTSDASWWDLDICHKLF